MSRILRKNRADQVEHIVEILYTIAKVPKHYAANVKQIPQNLVVAKSFDQLVYQSRRFAPNSKFKINNPHKEI
ncbi:MAG: hypothetical protein V7L05_12830 [Nostoc sp.]|uniref:hypothetical protein n=1 Tax=Nostoc sp. TaxID=1180 RepID=UPI002FF54789